MLQDRLCSVKPMNLMGKAPKILLAQPASQAVCNSAVIWTFSFLKVYNSQQYFSWSTFSSLEFQISFFLSKDYLAVLLKNGKDNHFRSKILIFFSPKLFWRKNM